MEKENITVEELHNGLRIDVFLAELLVDRFSRSKIKKMIEDGFITVSGRNITPHYKIKSQETINISIGESAEVALRAQDIPIKILHEDEDLIVVNKPAGLVVHPAHGNPEGTLVNALLFHVKKLSQGGGPVRPGIVHRLDKDTSGILVVAKNDQAHRFLALQFKNHTIERTYNAVVQGLVQHEEGICEEPVGRAFLNRKKIIIRPTGGKDAKTLFKVVKRFKKATLLEVYPKTGRTHQIRVHMAFLGHPVLGDVLYGIQSPWIGRQALHARILGFKHPSSREMMRFDAEIPSDMRHLISHLESTD